MKQRASDPWLHPMLGEWCVDVRWTYEPSEEVGPVHMLCSFPTLDEASAFVAETNGMLQ